MTFTTVETTDAGTCPRHVSDGKNNSKMHKYYEGEQ